MACIHLIKAHKSDFNQLLLEVAIFPLPPDIVVLTYFGVILHLNSAFQSQSAPFT